MFQLGKKMKIKKKTAKNIHLTYNGNQEKNQADTRRNNVLASTNLGLLNGVRKPIWSEKKQKNNNNKKRHEIQR